MQKIQHRAVISTLYNYASVFANTYSAVLTDAVNTGETL
tara:strand:+ start:52 stop:168 length:117 start_codon:yes stop_codon:yes gene_type:complete